MKEFMTDKQKINYYMELYKEYKESWESAEKDVDYLTDENLELKQSIDDMLETITYYEVILKKYREKLVTYKK